MVYYFAYGSNISENRMRNERNVNYEFRKFAVLENYKMIFNKVSKNNVYLGFANIVESEGDIVQGALYLINSSDINTIDKYEGVKNNHYYRTIVNVICDGEKINAITYIANQSMIRENIKPDKKYLSYILEGKDLFTVDYYEKILETKTLD